MHLSVISQLPTIGFLLGFVNNTMKTCVSVSQQVLVKLSCDCSKLIAQRTNDYYDRANPYNTTRNNITSAQHAGVLRGTVKKLDD